LPISACKKKLYALDPKLPPRFVPTVRTRRKSRSEPADPKSLQRQVRQLLADKISGNQVGIWLLLPEHLRLGTWDLLCGWSRQTTPHVEPRLALHLVHESALCVHGIRAGRSLSQKGFEVACGLPFVPADSLIHDLLEARSVADSQNLQIALGKLRRASHHFHGKLLAIDPHRLRSYSKRQMRRHRFDPALKALKMGQTFFCLDVDTQQPICFTLASSAQTVTQATLPLVEMITAILNPEISNKPLVLADKEHYSTQLIDQVHQHGRLDLLVAMPNRPPLRRQCEQVAAGDFKIHWPGYAIAKQRYRPSQSQGPDYYQIIQRSGGIPEDYFYQSFLATADRPELEDLSVNYPKRWHVEEFFKFNQDLGWERAGTLNLNVRYGQMSLALVAQAIIHQLRQRLGKPFVDWDAAHLAQDLFGGLEGDVRVIDDTLLVTYYNAPKTELLRQHYESLEKKLSAEGVSNRIPWLYDFKLDFRFK
jgi:hypothetical protein